MKTRTIIALCSSLAVSSVACGGSDQPAKSADDTTTTTMAAAPPPVVANPPEPVAQTGAATTGREGDPSQTPPAALSAGNGPSPTEAMPTLSDDQVIEIVHTANAGEIAQAKLAETKSKDAHVRHFAAIMLREHMAADSKGMRLAKKDNLNPAASPASEALASDAENNTTSLSTQAGSDFDKAYIDTQVKEHQAVLDTINNTLVPNAKSDDVKAYLTDVRAAVAAHLQHAKDLQTALSSK